jgi:hypothetical protein
MSAAAAGCVRRGGGPVRGGRPRWQLAGPFSCACVKVRLVLGALDDTLPSSSVSAVSAVLWAGFPGEAGGQALANLLFGAAVAAGRMPYTIYSADYVDQVGALRWGCVCA